MKKYFIIQKLFIDLGKTDLSNSCSLYFDDLLILYDHKSEAKDRLVREFLLSLNNDKDLSIDKETIYQYLLKSECEFEYTSKDDDTISNHFVSMDKNSLYMKMQNKNICLESEKEIVEIEKNDILYTMYEVNTGSDYNIKKVFGGIYLHPEQIQLDFSNFSFSNEKIHAKIAILDKSKINTDKNLAHLFLELGFLQGFNIKAANTLDYFDKDLINSDVLNLRKQVINEMNNLKKENIKINNRNKRLEKKIKTLEENNKKSKK